MLLGNTELWNQIDSARTDLSGLYYYDHEAEQEITFPAKDEVQYTQCNNYVFGAMDFVFKLEDLLLEIKLLLTHVRLAQDFALEHKQFSPDIILEYSYKNWIIRINTMVEQLVYFINHVYQLQLSSENINNKVFDALQAKNKIDMYHALNDIFDFISFNSVLPNSTFKQIKKARNKIVHNAQFKHSEIYKLQTILGLHQYYEPLDPEDKYITEGVYSEKIKKEIADISIAFLEKFMKVFDVMAVEFNQCFNRLMAEADKVTSK